MKSVRPIELLAPAKNRETGIAAIDHGADAVYIGAPEFSARAAAGNSLADIRELIEYAHIFHAKVYIALNTILYDDELLKVEKTIRKLYEIHADALIIQDMGILNLDIPPIALHASTQCDNRQIEKIRFLEEAGFSQIVLARELGLDSIKEIARHTTVPLEVFVHGALCVSYSGQCYISEALCGRSANRGECAQYCRLPYTLKDRDGKTIASGKHLLSLKDLNRSEHLEALLDAGVHSLKIEGRLKDLSYVKNTTAFYRQKLDEIFERRPEYTRFSSGKTSLFFHPDPAKSFNRGFTDYFLLGRKKDLISENTPKSMGEAVGNIKDLNRNFFTVSGSKTIHNGDGLCFLNSYGELQGFRVNKVEGQTIFPLQMPVLEKGITLFRNYNQEFERILQKKSAERKMAVQIRLEENNFGFTLSATDEDDCAVSLTIPLAKEIAQTPQQENIFRQINKLGATPFEMTGFQNELSQNWFIPSSVLSQTRRKLVERLLSVRKMRATSTTRIHINHRDRKYSENKTATFPYDTLNHSANIANKEAHAFYIRHGVNSAQKAYELEKEEGIPVMSCKYCIKHQIACCSKENKSAQIYKEPFTLRTGNKELQVFFDCKECEMQIIY